MGSASTLRVSSSSAGSSSLPKMLDRRLGVEQTVDRRPLRHHLGMTADELRDRCLSLRGADETFPFGPETSAFKVAGKVFALSRLSENPLRVSLKCEPPLAEQLRKAHAAVIPGYHLNKRHWNTVILDGSLPDGTIGDMVEDSYDLVVGKLPPLRQRALGWRSDA